MATTIPLFGIYRDQLAEEVAVEVLRSGQIASGAYVTRFEQGFGTLTCQSNVVTVNDMSSAIQIALYLSGVRAGDEVLTTSFACMSTNAPIAACGATARWVDVERDTGLMDPDSLELAITPRAKAVIVYHVAGYPARIARIAEICRRHGLKLIEDCDNALLAQADGLQVGGFGDFAIYSFYPNRQINATEGGALCCRRADDAVRAIRLRRYGIDIPHFRDSLGEIDSNSEIMEVGWAATLNNLCSAVGFTQLSSVADRISAGRRVAEKLRIGIEGLDGIEVVVPVAGTLPSYWSFLVRVERRDFVLATLKKSGIQVSKLHHMTDLYSGFHTPPAQLPNTRHFFQRVLGIPCGWWLNDQEVDHLIDALRRAVAG